MTQEDKEMLKAVYINHCLINILSDHTMFGCLFKSVKSQVVAHGTPGDVKWAEIHFLIQHKVSLKVQMLVRELDVTPANHLGLHLTKRTGSIHLLKFEDLISGTPLNLYTTINHEKSEVNYFTLAECLPFS
jgi:hypothetical protein